MRSSPASVFLSTRRVYRRPSDGAVVKSTPRACTPQPMEGCPVLHSHVRRYMRTMVAGVSKIMRTFNPVRFEAMARLLDQPDPMDLPRRSHVYRCLGDPNRRTTRFPEILMGWLQRRYLEIDVEEPLASASRTWQYRRSKRYQGLERRGQPANPGLRVLRPTGTD